MKIVTALLRAAIMAVANYRTSASLRNCRSVCDTIYPSPGPVCGSNGRTYSNYCGLLVSSCLNGYNIDVVHEGECQYKSECSIWCIQVWEPVCGSDGKTYGNACHLDAASCRKGYSIDMVHEGECQDQTDYWMDYDGLDNQAVVYTLNDHETKSDKLECSFWCFRLSFWPPVCGSDGKTYNTKCDLDKASCLNGYNIDMVHEGVCQDQTDYCRLPPMDGSEDGIKCMDVIPRYYFDGLSGTCKQFIYGGCGGNANNFKTKWECETHCVDNYNEEYAGYRAIWPF